MTILLQITEFLFWIERISILILKRVKFNFIWLIHDFFSFVPIRV